MAKQQGMVMETKHNYIPGQPYKMQNGGKAIFIGEHPFDPETLLFAHDNGQSNIEYYNRDGSWLRDGTESSLDIIGEWQEPKKVKGWVNVYRGIGNGDYFCVDPILAETKEQANKRAANFRIACIPIEFTEGEGL